jgi:hypothetical protein
MFSPRPLLALAVLLIVPPVAIGAGTQKVDSKVTYRNSFDDGTLKYIHEGEVKSDLKKCERDRTVRLYGEGVVGFFDSTQTNAAGEYRFEMDGDGIAGKYFTRVTKESKGSAVCKFDESPHKPLGAG